MEYHIGNEKYLGLSSLGDKGPITISIRQQLHLWRWHLMTHQKWHQPEEKGMANTHFGDRLSWWVNRESEVWFHLWWKDYCEICLCVFYGQKMLPVLHSWDWWSVLQPYWRSSWGLQKLLEAQKLTITKNITHFLYRLGCWSPYFNKFWHCVCKY